MTDKDLLLLRIEALQRHLDYNEKLGVIMDAVASLSEISAATARLALRPDTESTEEEKRDLIASIESSTERIEHFRNEMRQAFNFDVFKKDLADLKKSIEEQ